MTDVSGTTPPQDSYESQIDPAFSAAFNFVQAQEVGEELVEGAGSSDALGVGETPPAPPVEGAAGATATDDPPAGGAAPKPLPSAADLIANLNSSQEDGAGDGSSEQPAGAGVSAVDQPSGDGLDPATVIPAFAEASAKITERMENQFKSQAFKELEDELDPQFIDTLRLRPMQMVGMEVPSLTPGASPDAKIKILDSQMARDWQEAVSGLIEDEVQAKVRTRQDELRPMTSVIQESILLGQNNPDLIPGTKGFDKELAARFVKFAKAYEVKTAKGVIGYGVNVQPLINELRAGLAKERGVTGERSSQEARLEQQRQQAAAQARNGQGQFEAPQAGITSKAGMSGAPPEDYSQFWKSSGIMPGGMNLNI